MRKPCPPTPLPRSAREVPGTDMHSCLRYARRPSTFKGTSPRLSSLREAPPRACPQEIPDLVTEIRKRRHSISRKVRCAPGARNSSGVPPSSPTRLKKDPHDPLRLPRLHGMAACVHGASCRPDSSEQPQGRRNISRERTHTDRAGNPIRRTAPTSGAKPCERSHGYDDCNDCAGRLDLESKVARTNPSDVEPTNCCDFWCKTARTKPRL